MAKRKAKRGRPPGSGKKKVEKANIDNDAQTAIKQALKVKKRSTNHLATFQFEANNNANPGGRRPDPFSKKAVKAFTEADFKDILDVLIDQDYEAIKDIADAKGGHSLLKMMTARVALKVMATGSAKDFEIFLSRLIGKPKQLVHLTGDPQAPLPVAMNASVVITIPANGKEANQ